MPMPSTSFPAWPTGNHVYQDTCKSCEYCADPHSYSYHEDMHSDTDTESDWEVNTEDDTEYQTLVSIASDDP
eukprot:12882471-Prorocentrum_lima.AAC.1